MKRYFYTDPLAAAWMVKHHGVRMHNRNNGAEYGLPELLIHASTGNFCHMGIHPDSLHLLDPQIKDCVLIKSEGVVGFIYAGGLFGLHKVLPRKDTQMRIGECYPANDLTIIQRDGVAFMWPESDGA